MLTGPEKAVLFLLSLDETVAAPIVNELTEEDIRKLRTVASTMREVPAGALDETFREFLQRSKSSVAVPRTGLSYLRRLSASALGESRAREVFEGGETSPLARLEGAPPEAVAALLSNEPEQLAAAVLATLEPEAAAAILSTMAIERQATIITYVSGMTELPAKMLEDVAGALANELPTSDAGTLVSIDGVVKSAGILNAAGRNTSQALLELLKERDPELATQVKEAMFTFEDLARVDARAMREVLRALPNERVTLALKDAPEAVLRAVLAGLSTRAADMLREDLELLARPRKADVEAARRELVETTLRLEDAGTIQIDRGDA